MTLMPVELHDAKTNGVTLPASHLNCLGLRNEMVPLVMLSV